MMSLLTTVDKSAFILLYCSDDLLFVLSRVGWRAHRTDFRLRPARKKSRFFSSRCVYIFGGVLLAPCGGDVQRIEGLVAFKSAITAIRLFALVERVCAGDAFEGDLDTRLDLCQLLLHFELLLVQFMLLAHLLLVGLAQFLVHPLFQLFLHLLDRAYHSLSFLTTKGLVEVIIGFGFEDGRRGLRLLGVRSEAAWLDPVSHGR